MDAFASLHDLQCTSEHFTADNHQQPEVHNRNDPKTDNFKEKCIQICACMGIREIQDTANYTN